MNNFSQKNKDSIVEKIRNFSIIAHINHGKSTLADRFLERTNLKNKNFGESLNRVLDSLDLEQEKGITIKLNSVQLYYQRKEGQDYILNLIDTPGHVDFMYEVSKSLAACEGVVLLVDANKGIQAQTLAYYEVAKSLNLKILPVINKIDINKEKLEERKKELIDLVDCQEKDICLISAKVGTNVDDLIEKIIEFIPAPRKENSGLKCLIFDLLYNKYHGVIVYVRIKSGTLKKEQKIKFLHNKKIYQVERIGVKLPKETYKEELAEGDIGWFTANIRTTKDVRVGDTIVEESDNISSPLEGYQEIKPNIFSSIYPDEDFSFLNLKNILEELQIQDSSLSLESINSNLLGPGFRVGFLGLLHREIICERIKKEYNFQIINTPPTIRYRIKQKNNKVIETSNASEIPDAGTISLFEECFINIKINTPELHLGKIIELCQAKRGKYKFQKWQTKDIYILSYDLPFSEFIVDFHDKVNSISHGYASFTYEIIGYRPSKIVKVEILLNNEKVDDLAFLVEESSSFERAKKVCENLKETLKKQNFAIPIQAAIGKKIIARETLSALKKNVTGNMYGGDRSRKMKLWSKQKKGKDKMQKIGRVDLQSSNLKKMLKNLK